MRPDIDLIVPFGGAAGDLPDLLQRIARIQLGENDTATVVDNRAAASRAPEAAPVKLIRADERRSSYYARNRGAAAGSAAWLVFIDADVEAPADLLDRYFDDHPAERTAVLAGAVIDEPLPATGRASPAMRYSVLRARMHQGNTLTGRWGYAQTASCAVRRAAFEEVGGFRETLRSGGDADLCFRLRATGWGIESRAGAAVVHRSRRTLRGMLRQRARHGSGAGWLNREYPGSFPPKQLPGMTKWTLETLIRAAARAVRGDSDQALLAFVDPLEQWAFELGRLVPNETRRRGR